MTKRILTLLAVVVLLMVSAVPAFAHGDGGREKVEIAFCYTNPQTGESQTVRIEIPEMFVDKFKKFIDRHPYKTWGPCGGGHVDEPRCPTCGPAVWETAGDGMAMVWYSNMPCEVCKVGGDYVLMLDGKFRAWSMIPFTFEYPAGVLHEAEEVIGVDGNTYYVLEVDPHTANNALLWGPDGVGDRFRDHGPVTKYNACSVAPGYYDMPDGVAIYKGGHTQHDWVKFLTDEGLMDGNDASAFFEELREVGQLALPE